MTFLKTQYKVYVSWLDLLYILTFYRSFAAIGTYSWIVPRQGKSTTLISTCLRASNSLKFLESFLPIIKNQMPQ